jgi:hypothetical protein
VGNANFSEPRKGEVRRKHIPRTRVNKRRLLGNFFFFFGTFFFFCVLLGGNPVTPPVFCWGVILLPPGVIFPALGRRSTRRSSQNLN